VNATHHLQRDTFAFMLPEQTTFIVSARFLRAKDLNYSATCTPPDLQIRNFMFSGAC
jgi:hypothetical protein